MDTLEIKLKEEGKISRLTNKTFQFDKRLGEGFFAANYFLKSYLNNVQITLQQCNFSKEQMIVKFVD